MTDEKCPDCGANMRAFVKNKKVLAYWCELCWDANERREAMKNG